MPGARIVISSPDKVSLWYTGQAVVCLSVDIFKLEYLRNQWANRNEILSEPSLGWGIGCIRFGPDRIELWCPWQRIAPIGLKWGKCCDHSSAFIFDRIFFILAGKENIHNISDEFEIQPDGTKDCGVSCP